VDGRIARGQFAERLVQIKTEMLSQGKHVLRIVEATVEAAFDRDRERAQRVIEEDRQVDANDIRIERECVNLLTDAAAATCEPGETHSLTPFQIRLILTIVKVNNEVERIADLAVTIANQMDSIEAADEALPGAFRMIANSVLGMLQETVASFETLDSERARAVLRSDDATEEFREAILRASERQLAAGSRTADFAFTLNRIAAALARMADHCTNICEQVIYVDTGKIVRHDDSHWTDPEDPDV
jgi:phosphate transport system protein